MSANLFAVNPQAGLPPARAVLAELWAAAGLDPRALARFSATGSEPALRSSFAVGTALQAALGAATLAATEVGRLRGATAALASVELLDVVRESACRFTLEGRTPAQWDKLSGLYRCGAGQSGGSDDGGDHDSDVDPRSWVRIHTNFAHHRDGVLALLGLPPGPGTERNAVEAALRHWSAQALESAAAERGLVVAALRSPAEWAAHPQAAAVATEPLLRIERAGAAAAPLGWLPCSNEQRLAGLRVLELTRILAGPVAGRTLAAQGADVLLINGPHLPNIEALAETSRGKLSALLDLRTAEDRATLRALIRNCDVFLQSYRPGALAAIGFGPEELERLRPGIVSVSLSAYGTQGPWAGRRGFDSLVQSATGLNVAEARALGRSEPCALPLQALDFGAGYLLAFGALAALVHQRQQGGNWRVQVSLAGVGRWLQYLGRIADPDEAPNLDFEAASEDVDSGFGRLRAVRHAAHIGGRRLNWRRPSMPPGSHAPAWPDQT
jgi:hypothetical protein